MKAVTIHDFYTLGTGKVLAVNLIDVLRLCEEETLASRWQVSNLECVGELSEEFHQVSDSEELISGSELMRLAAGVYQVVDGDFEAFREGIDRWWLVIRAVDSSLYVVITEDAGLLRRVENRWSDVRPSPLDAEYRNCP